MKINNAKDLDTAIEELERRKVLQEAMLTDQFHATVDHFKPKNLLKAAFHKVADAGSTRSTILKTLGGLGIGLLTKNILIGKSTNLLTKLAANALKVGATNTVLHNTDKISAWSKAVYKNLFTKNGKATKSSQF